MIVLSCAVGAATAASLRNEVQSQLNDSVDYCADTPACGPCTQDDFAKPESCEASMKLYKCLFNAGGKAENYTFPEMNAVAKDVMAIMSNHIADVPACPSPLEGVNTADCPVPGAGEKCVDEATGFLVCAEKNSGKNFSEEQIKDAMPWIIGATHTYCGFLKEVSEMTQN